VESKFGVRPKLIESDGGVFEVVVDGQKIFSKIETGRFPEKEEIFSALGEK
jgi:selenoprotein W-related protein